MKNTHSIPLLKYPRTAHLEGSRLQEGDDASDQVRLASLAGQYVVLEEKLDGANCAISFTSGGELLLQSRGHYLTGGGSERQFNLLKPWVAAHEAELLSRLEDRFVMYGEWCYAKHSCWYDRLPAYFLEFDIYDRREGRFLSTAARRALLDGSAIVSVPVLYEGPMPRTVKELRQFVRPSLAKSTAWRQQLEHAVQREGQSLALVHRQTDLSDLAEGLYAKTESVAHVEGRYKWVRSDFVQAILDSGSHHSQRPILPNQLAEGVDLYAPRALVTWEDLGLHTVRQALQGARR